MRLERSAQDWSKSSPEMGQTADIWREMCAVAAELVAGPGHAAWGDWSQQQTGWQPAWGLMRAHRRVQAA